METAENAYCRFCAEPKSPEKLIDLQEDGNRYDDIVTKLNFLNAQYVDVNTNNTLPKTVCLVCYESLNKAYVFLDKVKKAQVVLTDLFSVNDGSKYDISDDERMGGFDDFLPTENVEDSNTVVKEEDCRPDTRNIRLPSLDTEIVVKSEPKDEESNTNLLEPFTSSNKTLNVQDIIEAAMCSVSLTPNIEIYEKDLSDLAKNVIKTWKDYPWMCGLCNIEFLDIDMLRLHAKAVHNKCAVFMCIDCKVTGKDNFNSFMKHIRKHRKSLRYLFCHLY